MVMEEHVNLELDPTHLRASSFVASQWSRRRRGWLLLNDIVAVLGKDAI